MTKEGVQQLDAILKFTVVGNAEIAMLENWMKEHIDKNVTICRHCSAQIRHAFQRVQNWASANAAMIDYVRNYEEPNKCSCGGELPDKRYKYCSDACKNK
jgi:hypothetical protein